MNQADVARNAPETVGGIDYVCNVCALATITKPPVPRVAETQAEEKLERVFTDVMGPFRYIVHCQIMIQQDRDQKSSFCNQGSDDF